MGKGGGAATLSIAYVLASGCQPQAPEAQRSAASLPPEVRVDRQTCEADAVRLTMPVDIRAAPAAETETLVHLKSGAFVYLCETRGGYRAVIFPDAGESVDCAAHPCRAGWVREPIAIELYG